jgi:hypothetical protein
MAINDSLAADYVLTGNIDCAGVSVSPLGNATVPFSGTINGAGYTISNLDYGTDDAGFFGGYDVPAYNEVYNITFDNVTVVASTASVALIINEPTSHVFMNDITVINSALSGGQNAMGAIVGDSRNAASSSDFNINLKNIIVSDSTINGGSRLSPVVGRVRAGAHVLDKIDVNNVNVTSSNQLNGGIIGDCASATNCTVTNSSFNGRIVAGGQVNGGIIGQYTGSAGNQAVIKNSYAKGYIQGTTRGGGILAYMVGTSGTANLDNVYSAIILNSTSGAEGGGINARTLVGNTINIDNSFAINGETQTVTQNGGMIGTSSGSYTVTNFVWQNTTTTATTCVDFGGNNTNCTVQDTTSYYYEPITNVPLNSWDFNTVWYWSTSDTPCLQWESTCNPATVPSSSVFNTTFALSSGTTDNSYYILEFDTTDRGTATAKDPATASTDTATDQTKGDYALDIIEISVCGNACQITKSILGMLEIPLPPTESFIVPFRIDTAADSGDVVTVNFDVNAILSATGFDSETFDTSSLRVYTTDIVGNVIAYNSTQDDIPFRID